MTLRFGSIPLFAAMAGLAMAQEKPLPARVDLRPEFEKLGIAVRAQGERDVCSIFALTGVADFEASRHAPEPHARLSEEFLIWAGNRASGLTGDQAMFYKAAKGLNDLGICGAELLPYGKKANPAVKPSPAALADARALSKRWRVMWIKRWDVQRPLTTPQLTTIKRALAGGHPVACGLRWPKTLKGADIVNVPPPSAVFDGHSIVFAGYEDDPKRPGGGFFIVRNSWGDGWGEKGYGTMSYGYAEKYANDALWLKLEPPDSEIPTLRFEAETMAVVARHKCEISRQKMDDFGGGLWSRHEQLFCQVVKGGDVELAFEVAEAGRYRLRVLGTAAPDFGVVRIRMDGDPRVAEFDLYSGRVCPSGSLELGPHDLGAGRHVLKVTCVGKDPASGGLSFGLDALDLIRAN